jgi:outer membrane protein assembly factor BamD (BamD/ComL family)
MLLSCRAICLLILASALAASGCATFGAKSAASASITDNQPAGEGEVRQASFEDTPAYVKEEEESSWWESLYPTNWANSATKSYKKITGQEPRPELARTLYAEAEEEYRRAVEAPVEAIGEYKKRTLLLAAGAKYAEAASRWPDSALEQDGLYMAAESYFFADSYPKANTYYEKLIKKYPGTKYMDTIDARRYAIAQYWLEITDRTPESMWGMNLTSARRPWRDTRGHALRIYDKIRIDDPTGKLADDATLAAANAHFVAGNYFKADEYYGDLRKAFPMSEHQFKAHFLGLKTKLLSYQGSQYSGDALDEADKIIKQIKRQFPNEARQEHEFLARAAAEVRFKKAEREWDLAQYYVRRGEYGSARLYQQTLVDEFDDTPYAERAREQLGEQRDLPAQPTKYGAWLVDYFPREEPAKPWFYSDAPPKK